MTETDLCNKAGGKLGGFGDVLNGNAIIASIDGADKVSTFCKFSLPMVRRKAIADLANLGTPFRETIRFVDLGAELDSNALPEIGQYEHAFNLPGDYLGLVMQFNENFMQQRQASKGSQSTLVPIIYQCEIVADKAGTGKILLTNTLSNAENTSAFIEYVIDITEPNTFSPDLVECIATLLASVLAPVVGRDIETSDNMLIKYKEIAIPDAKRANQKGFNATVRSIPDLSGGRSQSRVFSLHERGSLHNYI